MERNPKKLIGILTNASKTFKMISRKRVLEVRYDQLSKELENKKQFFSDFLGGNFREINTLVRELSFSKDVSVVLYLGKDLFISQNFKISPYELTHPKTIGKSLDFHKWLNRIDALIISLYSEKLREFVNLYLTRVGHMDKPCIISTGRLMIDELSKRFQGKLVFVERKGVARFGFDNRQKILALLG